MIYMYIQLLRIFSPRVMLDVGGNASLTPSVNNHFYNCSLEIKFRYLFFCMIYDYDE